jgi:syntaxin 16
MYLRALGLSRDRSNDLMSFRGIALPRNRECPDSPLNPYFQAAVQGKRDLSDLQSLFDSLLRMHRACLRPTFADASDSITEIESQTSKINVRMQAVQRCINYLSTPMDRNFPDRIAIVANLRAALTDAFRDFSAQFRLQQQAFSANLGKSPHRRATRTTQESDLDIFAGLGTPGSDQRQVQIEQQRSQEEIQQIARQAEDIRNIFVEISTLVAQQGSLIDRIDNCIVESLENANAAHGEIEQAASYQKKSRMWICVVVLVVLIVLLLVMALLKYGVSWGTGCDEHGNRRLPRVIEGTVERE